MKSETSTKSRSFVFFVYKKQHSEVDAMWAANQNNCLIYVQESETETLEEEISYPKKISSIASDFHFHVVALHGIASRHNTGKERAESLR